VKVVIVGGGFGGLQVAKALRGAPVEITLVDRRNHHLFQPLLYQVATGGLSPANIAAPLRALFRKQRNCRVLLAEAVDVDPIHKRVFFSDGAMDYDILVLAAGACNHYFGHPEWEKWAPGLKSVEDALEIRKRVYLAFEAAEREPDEDERRAWLTFVVVGAGPTGVELAGTLAEIARHTLREDFRRIDPAESRFVLVDAMERVLPSYPPALSDAAQHALKSLGVIVRTSGMVTRIDGEGLAVMVGDSEEKIRARTVLWAAGVKASPLGQTIARRTRANLERMGRVEVQQNLALKGFPDIFVIGDLADAKDENGESLPGVAPVAIQEGDYVARVIRARLSGSAEPGFFRYRDSGTMVTVGRGSAVAVLGKRRLAGFPAWLLWLLVHIRGIVQFENRILVMLQWAWNYLTWSRSARLITGTGFFPLRRSRPAAPNEASREKN
jgi:NADH dehydrogenase